MGDDSRPDLRGLSDLRTLRTSTPPKRQQHLEPRAETNHRHFHIYTHILCLHTCRKQRGGGLEDERVQCVKWPVKERKLNQKSVQRPLHNRSAFCGWFCFLGKSRFLKKLFQDYFMLALRATTIQATRRCDFLPSCFPFCCSVFFLALRGPSYIFQMLTIQFCSMKKKHFWLKLPRFCAADKSSTNQDLLTISHVTTTMAELLIIYLLPQIVCKQRWESNSIMHTLDGLGNIFYGKYV